MKLPNDNANSTQGIRRNSNSDIWLTKRLEIIWQEWTPPELTFISQPEGMELSQLYHYVFNETGGRDVFIYVFDSGVNTTNPDFLSKPGGIKRGSIKAYRIKR